MYREVYFLMNGLTEGRREKIPIPTVYQSDNNTKLIWILLIIWIDRTTTNEHELDVVILLKKKAHVNVLDEYIGGREKKTPS